jgi:hypothetical protein
MLEPELCPAGFICSEFGLPQPVVQCPPGFYCPAGTLTDDLSSSIPADPNSPPYIGDYIPFEGDAGQHSSIFRRLLGDEVLGRDGNGDDKNEGEDGGDGDDKDDLASLGPGDGSAAEEAQADAEEQSVVAAAISRYSRRHKELRRLWRATPAGAAYRRSERRRLRRGLRAAAAAMSEAAPPAWSSAGVGVGGGGARRLDPRNPAPLDLQSKAPLALAFKWGGTGNYSTSQLYSPADESFIAREFFLNATDPSSFRGTPASMFMQAARAMVLNLLVSGPQAPTYAYMQSAPLKPVACLPGTFCLGGVSSSVQSQSVPINPIGITSPQLCTEGTYCRYATPSAAGTGACFPGHYCPPGTAYPLKTPLGNFAKGGANVAPTLCFPGTYAPLVAYSVCRTCPAGYSCQSYGTYEPVICGVGTYRSLADSISCPLCPFGTFNPRPGATDITDCKPCPTGRVCGLEQMNNLTQSVSCPDGHACGQATTRARQFDHACPAGHYCDQQTFPANMMDLRCPTGVYCLRGTKLSLVTRNQCSVGYFCPLGTATATGNEVQCPKGTVTLSGKTRLLDCAIAVMTICNKVVTEHYYDTLAYDFLGVPQVIGDASTVVEVLRIVNPVNETASDNYWFNDTYALSRVAPAVGPAVANYPYELIGRGFDPTMRLFCRWTITAQTADPATGRLGNASVPWPVVTVEGTVVSTYRLQCPLPRNFSVPTDDPVVYDAARGPGFFPATLQVTYLGGRFDPGQVVRCTIQAKCTPVNTSCTLSTGTVTGAPTASWAAFKASVAEEQKAQYYNGVQEEQPLPLADNNRWFELPGLHYARISMDLRHISREMVYDQHWRIAIYVDNSTCIDSACDVNRNIITDPNVRFTNYLNEEVTLVNFPCPKPIPMPQWFQSTSVRKNDVLNFTLTSYEDMRFHIEVQILYGLFLATSEQFRNSTSVRVFAPSRAKNFYGNRTNVVRELAPVLTSQHRYIQESYELMTIYDQSLATDVADVMLNMPDRYSATERGRVVAGFNVSDLRSDVPLVLDTYTVVHVSPVYWSAPPGDVVALTRLYREHFQEITGIDGGNPIYVFTRFLVPYVPYFSNCYGFDSNIFYAQLLEDDVECNTDPAEIEKNSVRANYPALPQVNDLYAVSPFQMLQYPIADSCRRTVKCAYEDALSIPLVLPRWYEVGDATEIFSILRNAISFQDFINFGATIDDQSAEVGSNPVAEGIDVIIHVTVDRTAAADMPGACTVLCIPRGVALDITYYLVAKAKKRIVSMTVTLTEFDRDATATSFNLDVGYSALGWLDLFFKFAFTTETYLVTFIGLGFALIFVFGLFWSVNRSLGQFRNGVIPPFNWLGFFSLTIPPVVTGVVIGTVPQAFVLVFIYMLFNGWKQVYSTNWSDNTWLLDRLIGSFQDVVVDPTTVVVARRGRIGAAFLLFGIFLMHGSAIILLPRKLSGRERRLDERRDRRELARNVWTPTAWKRLHLTMITICYSFFMQFMVEISTAPIFGTYIWYFIVAFKLADIVANVYLDASLHDALTICPLNVVMGITQGLCTMGAIDFKDYLTGFAIDSVLALLLTLYVGPSMDTLVGTVIGYQEQLAARVNKFFEKTEGLTLQQELELEERKAAAAKLAAQDALDSAGDEKAPSLLGRLLALLPAALTGRKETKIEEPNAPGAVAGGARAMGVQAMGAQAAGAGAFAASKGAAGAKGPAGKKGRRVVKVPQKNKKRRFRKRIKMPGEEGGGVEDVLSFMTDYVGGAISVLQAIHLVYYFITFRNEVGLPDAYGIKAADLYYYLYFSIFTTPFQFLADMLLNSAYESFWGYKFYEYLVYARYRFLKRETRWKGMEKNVDECIGESLRGVDQMCFSSQFSFEIFSHSQGMFFFVLGLVVITSTQYNFFADPCFVLLVPIMLLATIASARISLVIANIIGLWQIPDRGTGWHSSMGDGANDKFGVPDPADIETLKRIADAASTDNYIMNQKITQDTFRYKFMDHNRLWLVEQLPAVFTPRTLQRSRPYLIKQLAQVLGLKPPADGLDEDLDGLGKRGGGDDDDVEDVGEQFGPVAASPKTRELASWWLANARRRLRMRETVAVFVARAKRPTCELCASGLGLKVELMLPTDELGERWAATHPRDRELDVPGWKAFFVQQQRFRTVCTACAERRKRAVAQPAAAPRDDDVEALLAQQERDKKYGPLHGRGDPRFGPVFVTPASRALAQHWLDKARRRRGTPVERIDPRVRAEREAAELAAAGLDPPRFAGVRVAASEATRALATRWLQQARFILTTRGVRAEELATVDGRDREAVLASAAARPVPGAPPPPPSGASGGAFGGGALVVVPRGPPTGLPPRPIVPGGLPPRPLAPGGLPPRPLAPGGLPPRPLAPGGLPPRPLAPGDLPPRPPGGRLPPLPGGLPPRPAGIGGLPPRPPPPI